jgi:hypothetical protein
MKANRQRLLTTISVVVDCWDRAHGPDENLDLTSQLAAHIEDMRDILHEENAERTRHRQNRESTTAKLIERYLNGPTLAQKIEARVQKRKVAK